ncbi:phosphoenolpyruvate--protein phosphotransferase, partial [Listeria monocytogenes]|nr:phosphoenolpyruvate--protein phosphotransferase [Listeria monocytogenes]
VVVAADLTPSFTAQLNRNFVKGFVKDICGRTSQSAIMARSLEIPAVVGTKEVTASVEKNDIVIIDGFEGNVIIHHTEEQLSHYEKIKSDFALQQAEW